MAGSGIWLAWPCTSNMQLICEKPVRMTGAYKMTYKNPSLVNRPRRFWFNSSIDDNNKSNQEFQLSWQIESGSLPDVMELVRKDLEGSVSTPGLGSLPPPNYYKKRHEYTAVIELPHNIAEVIGDGALVVDIDIVPDDQSKGHVELSTGEPRLEYNNMRMNWIAAEKFCVSKGGHLASVTSSSNWQRLQSFMARFRYPTVWLGGTEEANEGNWTWSDGSKWSVERVDARSRFQINAAE